MSLIGNNLYILLVDIAGGKRNEDG